MKDLIAEAAQHAADIEAEQTRRDAVVAKAVIRRSEQEGKGRPGEDFNRQATVDSIARMLTEHGYTSDRRNGDDKRSFTRPGKDASDGNSGTLFGDKLVYFNFSGNDPYLAEDRGYSAFGLYAHLYHGGDCGKAAKELSRQGYGDSPKKQKSGDHHADAPPAVPAPTDRPDAPTQQDQPPRPSFEFVHNAEILADLRPVEWRIRDVLTDYSLYYNFGDPGHFKTFVELDRLLCIASGTPYHGHPVKQGTVFYICGEGFQGIGRRIAAWHRAHGTKAEDIPFFVSRTPTELMALEAVENVCRAVDAMAKEFGRPAAVQFDTLARNFGGGDENATKDMNTVISNLDKAFGSSFCRGLTHHTGHGNKERARGAMALHGAADGAFKVAMTAAGQITVECKKLKDAAAAPVMLFDRREILLQIGDTQDRSYVLELAVEGEEAACIARPKTGAGLKGNLSKALDILRRLYSRHAENLKKGGRSSATPLVLYSDWRTACSDAGLYPRSDNFRRAAEQIILSGFAEYDESRRYVQPIDCVQEGDE